jgi:hypothetical protein
MEEAKELLKSLLRSSVHETTEDLPWSQLSAQEKRTCLSNGTFDIDFCAFSGLVEHVLSDQAVLGLLSNLPGTFVKSPYSQRLYGYRYQKVLVICDIRPFKLALTINECLAEDDQNLMQTEEKESLEPIDDSTFTRNVSDLLGMEKGRTFAFRDVRTKISTLFHGFELICFQFGQKQEIEIFLAHVEKMDSQVKLSVAVGMEVFLNGYFLSATPENISVGECFFPMLLSRSAGSILCPSKHAKRFASRSQRQVLLTADLSAIPQCIIPENS